MRIRPATAEDFDSIWHIFEEVVRVDETYVYPLDISRADGRLRRCRREVRMARG